MSPSAHGSVATFSEDWYEPADAGNRALSNRRALSQKRGIESSMLNEIRAWPALVVGWVRQRLTNRDEVGASLVEYALLLALIAVVAITALVFLGHSVSNALNNVSNSINNSSGP
jgi:pilus assembly protein Flp/PilA